MSATSHTDAKKRPAPAAPTTAATRLTQALQRLIDRDSRNPTPQSATVTELCQQADVSRNSLYRYHLGILKALRKHQCRRLTAGQLNAANPKQQRVGNASLHEEVAKLAALIDHYYAAYREASVLLERRERELAEVRRTLNLMPVLLKSRRVLR